MKIVLEERLAENLWIRMRRMFSRIIKKDQRQEIFRDSEKLRRFLLYFPP